MFQNDYLLRQIETMAKALASTLLNKSFINEDGQENDNIIINEEDFIEYIFNKLIAEEKINEAENMLYDKILTVKSEKNLNLALLFYSNLSRQDDERLIKLNFTREEIAQGLQEIEEMIRTL